MINTKIFVRFGEITINNNKYSHDVIILPNGNILKRPKHLSSKKKAFYGHTPLSKEELEEILSLMGDVEVIIIGTGIYGALPIEDDALKLLENKHISVIKDKTPKAIEKFIEQRNKGLRVGAIFHVTC